MKKFVGFGLIVLMILSLCSVAYAGGKGASYSKAERGTRNIVLGLTEIPKSIRETTKEENALVGITFGTLEGILNAFARTVSGIIDVGTLPMGSYDKPAVKPSMVE